MKVPARRRPDERRPPDVSSDVAPAASPETASPGAEPLPSSAVSAVLSVDAPFDSDTVSFAGAVCFGDRVDRLPAVDAVSCVASVSFVDAVSFADAASSADAVIFVGAVSFGRVVSPFGGAPSGVAVDESSFMRENS